MRKNEPTASLRTTLPIPFYDANGALVTGLNFAGAGETAVFNLDALAFADTASDAVEAAATGMYYVQLSQAETNHPTFLIVRLRKATYSDQFFIVPIDDTTIDTVAAAVTAIAAAITALGVSVARVLGLLHENAMLDGGAGVLTGPTYSDNNVLESARLRVFANAAALAAATEGAANGADGEIYRYAITGADNGDGLAASFQIAKEL